MQGGGEPVLENPPQGSPADGPGRIGALLAGTSARIAWARNSGVVARWVPRSILMGVMALFFLSFTVVAVRLHDGYGTSGYDLGIFDQGVWLLSRLKVPFITITGVHLFGDHGSFILALLAPLYWLWPSPSALLVVQSLALVLGAVPAYLIGKRLLHSEWLALVIGLLYLLHPTIAFVDVWQFHPDAFEAPLFLWAVWFMLGRRWRGFAACLVLLVLIKEDVALVTLCLGLFVAWRYDRRVGAITVGASVAWLIVEWAVLLPYFSAGLPDVQSAGRMPFGGIQAMITTALRQPGTMLRYLVSEGRPWYVFQLLAPFGFLALASPFALVAAGPLAFNLLSTHGYQHQIRYHYSVMIVAILVVATTMALARVRSARRRRVFAVVVLLISVWTAFLWGPSKWSRAPVVASPATGSRIDTLRRAQALIPPAAAVSADSLVVPHLSHRRLIFNYPTPFRAEYWADPRQAGKRLPVADLVEYVLIMPESRAAHDSAVATVGGADFETLVDKDGVLLLHRKAAP